MSNNIIKTSEYEAIEPMARVAAATVLSQQLSFCFERKYLSNIEHSDTFKLRKMDTTEVGKKPQWLKIEQIGKPLKDSAEECFTAMQKILSSCFIPNQAQLLFLLNSIGGVSSLYIGIRPVGEEVTNDFSENLNNFICGIWPGLRCYEATETEIGYIQKKIAGEDKKKYRSIVSLTGIPSMESQYKTLYPATIDKLIAGMINKDFSYLVVAEPIGNEHVEQMLYTCRELNGKAESLKSINFSEGINKTVAESIQESVTKKDWSGTKNKALGISAGVAALAGLGLSAFPQTAHLGMSVMGLGGMAISMMDQKTTGKSSQESIGSSKTISRNLVNKHIEAISEHIFYQSKRLETGKAIGCWNVGVYLLGECDSDVQSASIQLKSILSGNESIYEPIRVHNIADVMKPKELALLEPPKVEIFVNDEIFAHPLGDYYRELTTVLTTKELSYLVNFPLRSVPGISVVDSAPEFSLNQLVVNEDIPTVDFGQLLYGGSETEMAYRIPIESLARHTLLSGVNGSGKTNTVQAVLNSISQRQREIPFLVIEPAKTEYVDWAIEYNKLHKDKPIKIFIPGCKTYRDKKTRKVVKTSVLHLNPFEPVWLSDEQDPNILTHIDRLKSTFAAAFPMYDILPVLMEDLIYTLYQSPSTNWIGKDANPVFGKTLAPTLTSMAAHVDKVIEAHGYEKRVCDNMKACLNTRIGSLRRGWKKEMLDVLHSTPWEDLFGQPCVINLSYVGDDVDKSFFMSLILQFLYEYRSAQAECGLIDFNSNNCRHLTIIEEAHRVMQKCEKPEEPQYKTAMMFSNMLSEIRAYGEGMFLVDQIPTRLIPDAIKNTNTKITHRLISEDDCKAISESMGISKEQRMIIPRLLVGQCIVSTALSTDKHWIKVNQVKKPL